MPNGQDINSDKYPIKLEFLKKLTEYYKLFKEEALVIGGDFNIALTDLDAYDPIALNNSILFSIKERQELRRFISSGLVDLYRINNIDEGYTWWDYRANSFTKNNGLRIDYLFGNPEAAEICNSCFVAKKWRGKEKASDHAPVSAIFSLK